MDGVAGIHRGAIAEAAGERIRDEQWLQSYRDVEGIRFALTNISRRFSRRPHLETAARHLVDSRVELERRFAQFMRM